jgi:cytochrome c553
MTTQVRSTASATPVNNQVNSQASACDLLFSGVSHESPLFYEIEMKRLVFILVLCAFNSFADDARDGRAKADAACALCHGHNGIATMPGAPNLAGQQPIYLSEQLKNYRSGKRQHEVMSYIAKPLTDAEITQLASWYSSIKVTVEAP